MLSGRILLSLLLENGYQVKLAEQESLIYQGQLKSFEGKFDYHLGLHGGGLSSNLTLSPENAALYGVEKLTTRGYYYGAGLSKRFDFGLSFEPRITYTQTEYEIPGISPFNQALAELIFNLPLLKELGKNIDAANVENAGSNYQAALDNYHHTISTEFFECLSAYINYIAAIEIYDAYEIKMKRADSLLTITKLMVEKDELPASEITIVEAYKGDVNLKLLSSGLAVNNQKAKIGTITGIDHTGFANLYLNSRKFLVITFLFNPDSGFILKSIEIALRNRKDCKYRLKTAQLCRLKSEQLEDLKFRSLLRDYNNMFTFPRNRVFTLPRNQVFNIPGLGCSVWTGISTCFHNSEFNDKKSNLAHCPVFGGNYNTPGDQAVFIEENLLKMLDEVYGISVMEMGD